MIYKCNVCDKNLTSRGGMKYHIHKVHKQIFNDIYDMRMKEYKKYGNFIKIVEFN